MRKMTFPALAAALFIAAALAGAQSPSPSPSPSTAPAPTQAKAPSTAEPGADKAMTAKGELVKVDADAKTVEHDAAAALAHAASHLDVRPTAFTPEMALALHEAESTRHTGGLRARLATPLQILATQFLGLVLPFFVYWGLDSIGLDITWPVYLVVVAALLVTATMIWVEGFLALRRQDPPAEPGAKYQTPWSYPWIQTPRFDPTLVNSASELPPSTL